jgi:hypothetical protein
VDTAETVDAGGAVVECLTSTFSGLGGAAGGRRVLVEAAAVATAGEAVCLAPPLLLSSVRFAGITGGSGKVERVREGQ